MSVSASWLAGTVWAAVSAGSLGVLALLTAAWLTPARPAGGRRVDAGRDFTAAEIAAGKAFHAALRPWTLGAEGAGLALGLLLGLTRLGAGLIGWVGRLLGGGWVAEALGGAIAVSLLHLLVTLPWRARTEALLRAWGVSTRRWSGWGLDLVKGWLLSTGLLAVAALALFAAVRAHPQWWWVGAAAVAAAVVAVLSFVVPVVVEPMFARFTPMPAGPLRESLLDLARVAGVRVRRVLVADASRRTTALNAYVSGLGATRRIVVFDTLITGGSEQNVRLVVAHELGHARRRDVARGTWLGALGLAAAMPAFAVLGQWHWVFDVTGSAGLADPRSLPLVLAVAGLVGLVTQPGQMLLSRRIEARADGDALDLTGDPSGFAEMQRGLALANRSDVTPPWWVTAWFGSHPTAPQRIAAARAWARGHAVVEPAGLAGERGAAGGAAGQAPGGVAPEGDGPDRVTPDPPDHSAP